jgi:hypothetical protein
MGKEGLATQDRGAGADTGMIIAKNVVRSIKKDAFFFAGELLTDADPFHCSTSVDRLLLSRQENDKLLPRNIERC